MCGIVGYIGPNPAAPFLMEGLSKLEYRGYDSAGVAVYDGKEIHVAKSVGRLASLRQMARNLRDRGYDVGAGPHTPRSRHSSTD